MPIDDSVKEDEDEERVTVRLYDMPMLVIWVLMNCREDVIKHILYVMSMIDQPIDEEVKCLVWMVGDWLWLGYTEWEAKDCSGSEASIH